MKDNSRNAFMMYKDNRVLFDAQTDEAAGQLIKAVFAYVCDGVELQTDNGMINMAFQVLRNAFDRDAEKYQATCERNREVQRKRWERKKEEAADRLADIETASASRPGSLGFVPIVQDDDLPEDQPEQNTTVYEHITPYMDCTDSDSKSESESKSDTESKTDTDARARGLVSAPEEEVDPYTPREIAQICKREQIPLNVYGITAFFKAMRATDWQLSGRPIDNIVAVLITYCRDAPRAFTEDLTKTVYERRAANA